MQTKFKNKEDYQEWLTYWRRQYAAASNNIIYFKRWTRKPEHAKDLVQHAHAKALLRREQTVARSLMMAREAVEQAYTVRKIVEKAPYFEADFESVFSNESEIKEKV